jgi:hypothetical protein
VDVCRGATLTSNSRIERGMFDGSQLTWDGEVYQQLVRD